MKSKLTMLTMLGALALSAVAPSAMAKSNQRGASSRSPVAVQTKAAKSITKKSSNRAAVSPVAPFRLRP